MVELKLEYAFSTKVMLAKRLFFGPTPLGEKRGFVGTTGGEVYGPRLQGSVVANSGGDYPHMAEDGGLSFDSRYLLQASDGTHILVHNRGFRHGPPKLLQALLDGKEVDSSKLYFRNNPSFEAPVGPHEWLTRHVFVGTCERMPDHSIFTYYIVN